MDEFNVNELYGISTELQENLDFMRTVIVDNEYLWTISVFSSKYCNDNGIDYFKVFNNKKCLFTRICFKEAKYIDSINNNGKNTWMLDNSEKEILVKILKDQWKNIINEYNDELEFLLHDDCKKLSADLEMPDYMKLIDE